MLTKAARIKKCIWNIIVRVLSVSPPVRSFLITSCGLKPLASVLDFSHWASVFFTCCSKGPAGKAFWTSFTLTRLTGLRPVLLRPGKAFLIPCQMPFVCLPCFCFFLVCNGESRDPTNDNCPHRERFMKPTHTDLYMYKYDWGANRQLCANGMLLLHH